MKNKHLSENDFCFLLELADSRTGFIARSEIAEMYNISVDELESQLRQLENLDTAVLPPTSDIESEL
jgi:hypothetical protein